MIYNRKSIMLTALMFCMTSPVFSMNHVEVTQGHMNSTSTVREEKARERKDHPFSYTFLSTTVVTMITTRAIAYLMEQQEEGDGGFLKAGSKIVGFTMGSLFMAVATACGLSMMNNTKNAPLYRISATALGYTIGLSMAVCMSELSFRSSDDE